MDAAVQRLVEAFTPSLSKLKPAGELEAKSIALFQTLPSEQQTRCIEALRKVFAKSVTAVAVWSYTLGKGMRIGSDDLRFHFGTGMQIRNCLRGVLSDARLPPVEQPGRDFASNWDDYYYGALHAALMWEIEHGHE